MNFKVLFSFITPALIAISAWSKYDGLPEEFYQHFRIDKGGSIFPVTKVDSIPKSINFKPELNMTRVFENGDGFHSKWSVTSSLCQQNKQNRCLGVFNRIQNYKGLGYGGLFAVASQTGTFSLYEVDDKSGVLKAVTKCRSENSTLKVGEQSLKDGYALSDCKRYTEVACKEWSDYITNQNQIHKIDLKKIKEVSELVAAIKAAKIKMTEIFQTGLSPHTKDLREHAIALNLGNRIPPSVSFDLTKRESRGSGLEGYDEALEVSNECDIESSKMAGSKIAANRPQVSDKNIKLSDPLVPAGQSIKTEDLNR